MHDLNPHAASIPEADPQAFARGAGEGSTTYWGPGIATMVLLAWAAALAIGFIASLAIVTALGFALAVIGLRRPFLGLLGVGILCTTDSLSRVYLMAGGLLRWNTFNYWLLAVMVFASPLLLRRHDIASRLLQIYLVVLVAGLLYSPSPMSGMHDVLNTSTLFGLLVYFSRVRDDGAAWYWLGVVNGTLAAACGLVYWLHPAGLNDIDTNALANPSLTALFSLGLAFRFADQRRSEYLLGLLAILNFCWIFLTGSRGALFVGVLCLGVFAMQIRGRGRRIALSLGAAILGIAILAPFADLKQRTLNRVTRLVDSSYTVARRTSGRSDLILGAWRIFQDHPLGVGTGGFVYHFVHLENLEGLSPSFQGRRSVAHSLWLRVLAENGLVGFAFLAGYVFSFTVVGWSGRNRDALLMGLLASGALSFSFMANDVFGKSVALLAAGVTVLLQDVRAR